MIEQTRRYRPDIRIIIHTGMGYTPNEGSPHQPDAVLQKPYTPEVYTRVIEYVLMHKARQSTTPSTSAVRE